MLTYLSRDVDFGVDRIKIVNKYEYLGVIFESRGNVSQAASTIFAKASLASVSTRTLVNSAKLDLIDTINKVVNSLVASITLHGCQVWAIRHLDVIDRLQVVFYKRLLSLPPNTPGYAIRREFDR